jgi:hypothetical protein
MKVAVAFDHRGVHPRDCLGSEVVGPSPASELVNSFVNATFDRGERDVARRPTVAHLERAMNNGQVTAP